MVIFRVTNKFKKILSKHQKLRIFELVLLMVIGGFLEMASVSLILPFMEAVTNPEATMSKWYIKWFCNLFSITSSHSFLMTLAIMLASLYIFKNAFLLFQTSVQARFVYNNMFFTQKRLLNNYLSRPYEYFLGINSGEVLRVIGSDTTDAFDVLITLLSFCSEMVVSTALVGALFVITPQISLSIAAVLIVMMLLFLKLVRPALHRAGKEYGDSYASLNQWMLQSIQGIKEIKIMRKESYFETNFDLQGKKRVRALKAHKVLSLVPRYMIEAIAMSVFFIILAALIGHGESLDKLIPILSAVAMAAMRLLPSVNKIVKAVSDVVFRESRVDKLIDNLREASSYGRSSLSSTVVGARQIQDFTNSIEMCDVTYFYPENSRNVLNGASMSIEKGMSVGIVGASGAGKTTTVDLILGLLNPMSGGVFVDGVDIRNDLNGWLSKVGYIPQNIFMLDDSIRANVAFGVNNNEIDDENVWRALKEAAIENFVRSLPDGLDTQIGERGVRISGGQKQRIGIARALYSNPDILFFDEATSALDNDTEASIMESVKHLHGSKTMIIIAHRLTTIEECDTVYRVENGIISREK